MATTPNSIITVQTPKMGLVQFSTADAPGSAKTLITGSSNGTKVAGIYANSNDSAGAHLCTVQLQRSGVAYGGCAVSVPGLSGFNNGVPPVNFMSTAAWPGLPIDSDGNPFLFLASTADVVLALFATALSTAGGSVLNFHAVGGDF